MSKETAREAAAQEREFHRTLRKLYHNTDLISLECYVTDYLQKQIILHNKHSEDLELW